MENRSKTLKYVVALLTMMAFIMIILISGNSSLLTTLAVYIAMIGACVLAYLVKSDISPHLFGIKKSNLISSIIIGIALTILFYFVAQLTGLTIGLPRLPGAISDEVRKLVVLVFAPVIESIFFQSVIYSFILVTLGNKSYALVGQALVFASAHLGAYITGFYSYPSLPSGLMALGQNIGAFISAFIFALICMYLLSNKKVDNLSFAIVFHFGLNFVISVLLFVVFL